MSEKLKASLALIISDKEPRQVLLSKRKQPQKPLKHGLWHLPGGAVEVDETPEAAIRRELNEELGLLKFHILRHITLEQTNSDYADRATMYYIFLVEMNTGTTLDISQDPDASEARWFELTELRAINSFEMVTKAVKAYNI